MLGIKPTKAMRAMCPMGTGCAAVAELVALAGLLSPGIVTAPDTASLVRLAAAA